MYIHRRSPTYRKKTPPGTFPNCPYCNRPIDYIKRKGMCAIKVEPKSIMYIPQEDGPANIITPKGNKRKGIIVNDGTKGYIEHVCRFR